MGKYSINILQIAQNDLHEIIDYLNTLSRKAAIEYYDLIIESISNLIDMPERCPLAKDKHLRSRGYRILLVKNYMVFYVIKGKNVEIHRILYSRRQYKWLL